MQKFIFSIFFLAAVSCKKDIYSEITFNVPVFPDSVEVKTTLLNDTIYTKYIADIGIYKDHLILFTPGEDCMFQLYDKKTGEFIREYASMTDAAVDVGVTLSSITGCCMGRNKSAGGYLWSYTKRATVNVFRDARFLNTPSTEERVKALQQRIDQYTKLFNYAEEN